MARIALLFLIRVYQWTLSPFFGSCCRFSPSCSVYAAEVLKKYGAAKAIPLICKRIVKCRPGNGGESDPP